MNRYYLGIDVGGSKCHALLADEKGVVVGFAGAGGGNPEKGDYLKFAGLLNSLVTQVTALAGIRREQVAGAGFGVSGYDWPSQRAPTMEAIHQLDLACPCELVNDAILGLLAGSTRGWGIAVVAGSGSNAWGWDIQHNIGRMTGCGEQFGESAGGSDLTMRAVRAVALQWTHRGPPTLLTDFMIRKLGAKDPLDLLEGLVLGRYSPSHHYAPEIFQIAEQGDPVAREIIADMAFVLGDMALGVVRQLKIANQAFEIVMTGSLWRGGPLLVEPFKKTIQSEAPLAQLVPLTAPPVVGGVLLGMEQSGLQATSLRQTLIDSTRIIAKTKE